MEREAEANMATAPTISVIIDAFWRADLLKESVRSVRQQSYEKLEIILIDNGAEPEVKACLNEEAASDKRISLIHFEENQYSEDDPMRMVDICLNAGLNRATGKYVWYQSYDDFIASDYLERMARLFSNNPNCTSAAGLPVSVDLSGSLIEHGVRTQNIRDCYVHGRDLALDSLRGGNMFAAPGTIFTLPRELLIKSGGYHRNVEDSQMFGIVPFGESGFDDKAEFFWRRHGGQLNKKINATGRIFVREQADMLKRWNIEGRWRVYGDDIADEVVTTLSRKQAHTAARLVAQNFADLRYAACIRTVSMIGMHGYFWRRLPGALWTKRQQFAANFLSLLGLRKPLRRLMGRNA
jgi:hypothetical protein